MGKWAKAYFDALKKQEGEHFERKQGEALNRQQVMATAPGIWEDFISQIQEEVRDFQSMRPGHLTSRSELQSTPPKLTVSTPYRNLSVSFNREVPQINYSVHEPQSRAPSIEITAGEFAFQVRDQEVWLFGKTRYSAPRGFITTSDAIDHLLQKLAST